MIYLWLPLVMLACAIEMFMSKECDNLPDDLKNYSHWRTFNMLNWKNVYKNTFSRPGQKWNSVYKLCGIDFWSFLSIFTD